MITITGLIGVMIFCVLYWFLDEIRIELRKKNDLLKEQNEILKRSKNIKN